MHKASQVPSLWTLLHLIGVAIFNDTQIPLFGQLNRIFDEYNGETCNYILKNLASFTCAFKKDI